MRRCGGRRGSRSGGERLPSCTADAAATRAVSRAGAVGTQLRGCSAQQHSSPRWCCAQPCSDSQEPGSAPGCCQVSRGAGQASYGAIAPLCQCFPSAAPQQGGNAGCSAGTLGPWHGAGASPSAGVGAGRDWRALTSSALCACGWLSRKVPSSTEATMVRPLPALSCEVKDRSCGCTTFCS